MRPYLSEIAVPQAGNRLECRLLSSHAKMLTWTELAAYLSVVAALCGGGAAFCWVLLWKE